MHELSICTSIARIVEEAAGGRTVELVRLEVGHLRQVVPDTLVYCWDIAVRETPLEGVPLAIEHIPAVINCDRCGQDTVISVLVLRCGTCDSTDVRLLAGNELFVKSVDVCDPTRP